MANYLTFAEIITEVERAVKQYQSSMQDLVKSVINQVYLNEVLQCDNLYPLHWLHAPIREKLHAPKDVEGASVAAQCVITSTAHGFIGGEIISLWDIEGMTELNYDYNAYNAYYGLYRVDSAGLAANTFKLTDLGGTALSSAAFTAYTAEGTILHHGWCLSSGIAKVTGVGIHDGLPLDPVTWKDILDDPDTYFTSSSMTPTNYLHQQLWSSTGAGTNALVTMPGAQENKIAYVMIEVGGVRLSADGDVPLLPPQFHDTIISGCITRLAENNVQVENAVVWPSLYKLQIEAIKTYNRKWWAQHEKTGAGSPYLL